MENSESTSRSHKRNIKHKIRGVHYIYLRQMLCFCVVVLVASNKRFYMGVMSSASAISGIKKRIAERQSKRAENAAIIVAKQHDNAIIDAELVAWEEALKLIVSESDAASSGEDDENLGQGSTDHRRGPRGSWKLIMLEMGKRYSKDEFDLPNLLATAQGLGTLLNPATARSQMHNYVKTGMLDRIQIGRFRFTEQGLKALGGLSEFPNAANNGRETESPAADDVQAAGKSWANVDGVSP